MNGGARQNMKWCHTKTILFMTHPDITTGCRQCHVSADHQIDAATHKSFLILNKKAAEGPTVDQSLLQKIQNHQSNQHWEVGGKRKGHIC